MTAGDVGHLRHALVSIPQCCIPVVERRRGFSSDSTQGVMEARCPAHPYAEFLAAALLVSDPIPI
jgi:hypothetical protein